MGRKAIHVAELGLDKVEWLYNSPHNEFSCITLFYSIPFHSIFNQEHQEPCHVSETVLRCNDDRRS